LPVIVRGEEEKGLQLWKLNKLEYQRILSFLVDEEIGDIFDVEAGYDLVIKVTDSGKKWEGNKVYDKQIDPSRKASHLKTWFDNDTTKMQSALDNPPSVDDLLKFCRKTPSELKLLLDKWLAGDSEDESSTTSTNDESTTRGKSSNELDNLKQEVSKGKTKTSSKKKVEEEDLTETADSTASKSIDDAFNDLMTED
jgi:hypothetical protein